MLDHSVSEQSSIDETVLFTVDNGGYAPSLKLVNRNVTQTEKIRIR